MRENGLNQSPHEEVSPIIPSHGNSEQSPVTTGVQSADEHNRNSGTQGLNGHAKTSYDDQKLKSNPALSVGGGGGSNDVREEDINGNGCVFSPVPSPGVADEALKANIETTVETGTDDIRDYLDSMPKIK